MKLFGRWIGEFEVRGKKCLEEVILEGEDDVWRIFLRVKFLGILCIYLISGYLFEMGIDSNLFLFIYFSY